MDPAVKTLEEYLLVERLGILDDFHPIRPQWHNAKFDDQKTHNRTQRDWPGRHMDFGNILNQKRGTLSQESRTNVQVRKRHSAGIRCLCCPMEGEDFPARDMGDLVEIRNLANSEAIVRIMRTGFVHPHDLTGGEQQRMTTTQPDRVHLVHRDR